MKAATLARRAFRAPTGVAAIALLAVAVASASAADRLAPLLGCRALPDDTARLACFDRESAALAPRAAEPALSPEQKFGLGATEVAKKEEALGQPRADVAAVEGKVVELHSGADGRLVLTLDNGQVWRQLAPGGELLLGAGDHVKITRGALGSFWLAAPSNRGCKVTRVR